MNCLFCNDHIVNDGSFHDGTFHGKSLYLQKYCGRCKTLYSYIRTVHDDSYKLFGYCIYLFDYRNMAETDYDCRYWFLIDLFAGKTHLKCDRDNDYRTLLKIDRVIKVTPDNIEKKIKTYLSFM